MIESPPVHYVLALLAGLGLGAFYFLGLWYTLRFLTRARFPGLLVLAGFVVRTAVVVVCFYLVMGNRWEAALVCLVGFTLARLILVRRQGFRGKAPKSAGG